MTNPGDRKPVPGDTPPVLRAASPAAIAEAGRLIRGGQLVAFPTETVYGLGADATNSAAVARIFAAKGRPRFNPLIVHVGDLAAAERLGRFTDQARRIAAAFWPGPLTLVVARADDSGISELASAGLPTLAIRIPDHPLARALMAEAGRPLAAPSANRSGHVSATRADHVASDLAGRVAMILDGGPTAYGLESTVLDVTGNRVIMLRPGAVPADVIEAVTGEGLARAGDAGGAPRSPGRLASHYAPSARLRLNATGVLAGEALLAFGEALPTSGPAFNLSPAGDLIEAAANLFAALRLLDASGVATIAVMAIPTDGLGEAINDRLERASAPRR